MIPRQEPQKSQDCQRDFSILLNEFSPQPTQLCYHLTLLLGRDSDTQGLESKDNNSNSSFTLTGCVILGILMDLSEPFSSPAKWGKYIHLTLAMGIQVLISI